MKKNSKMKLILTFFILIPLFFQKNNDMTKKMCIIAEINFVKNHKLNNLRTNTELLRQFSKSERNNR